MWTEYFKRWIDIMFWWLPRHDRESQNDTSPRPEPSTGAGHASDTPASREESAQRVEPERVVQFDDLTQIKGIGATMQKRLHGLGIHSFAELASADADRLTEQLKSQRMVISRDRVAHWVTAARERR